MKDNFIPLFLTFIQVIKIIYETIVGKYIYHISTNNILQNIRKYYKYFYYISFYV